jgi:hypothetical protein
MNAKRISNHVKNNVHETSNFGELKRMLKQYEDKIRHLEAEKLREHNQSEELLSMVQRLMAQKKELIEKLSHIDNNENTTLNGHEKRVIAETLEFHQQLDGIIKKSYSRSDTSAPSRTDTGREELQEERPQCDSVDIFRFQNIKLITRVLQLQQAMKTKTNKTRKTGELLSGLLQDPSCLYSLSDRVLRQLKTRLHQSVEGIEEQLISRKLSKRLRQALQRIEVDVERKSSDYELLKEFSLKESSSGEEELLGKRAPLTKGVLKQASVDAILRGAWLPTAQEYSDTNLPTSIKMSLELVAEPEVQEIDLMEGSVQFDHAALDKAAAEVEVIRVKQGSKNRKSSRASKHKAKRMIPTIDLSKDKKNNDKIQIEVSEEEFCEEIEELSLNQESAEARSKAALTSQSGNQSKESKQTSKDSSQQYFRIEREPLSEKKNEPDASAVPQFASPKSSLYFFTSKKNEYDFSFDRSTIQVEKNLGERLLLSTIQKSQEKENKFRMQR